MEIRVTRPRLAVAFLFTALGPFLFSQSPRPIPVKRPSEYTFKIVRAFPHDRAAFTQGLAYRDGFLYEGTGLHGQSSLRKVRLETGEGVQQGDLAPEFFGECIALFENEVVQLTWQSHAGFSSNLSDLRLLRRFSYSGEGWSLTMNGPDIFVSAVTSNI